MRCVFAALIGAAVVPLCAGPASAQPPPEPKDGKVTVRLDLSPAAAPKPASDWYLLPEYKDAVPGNRVQGFMRVMFDNDALFGKAEAERRAKWHVLPIADLPPEVSPDYGGRRLRDADIAARMARTDWQAVEAIRRDGFGALVPELSALRAVADALHTRCRGEVRAGRLADAVGTIRTMLALVRMYNEHPTLIGGLVGAKMGAFVADRIEEMVQQPGCPNLFWSLADLPAQLIDLRSAAQGEQTWPTAHFRPLMEATGPLSDAELDRVLAEFDRMEGGADGRVTENPPSARLRAWAADPERVAADRKFLTDTGTPAAAAAAMTPLQVVAAADVRRYEVYLDEMTKWLSVPYPQGKDGPAAVEAQLKAGRRDMYLAAVALPAMTKARVPAVRLDQRFALLRVVEAVRLYAHDHAGQLPPTLADDRLPLPPDPVSGKPFGYAVEDGVATLRGEHADPGHPKTNRHYELRVRK